MKTYEEDRLILSWEKKVIFRKVDSYDNDNADFIFYLTKEQISILNAALADCESDATIKFESDNYDVLVYLVKPIYESEKDFNLRIEREEKRAAKLLKEAKKKEQDKKLAKEKAEKELYERLKVIYGDK